MADQQRIVDEVMVRIDDTTEFLPVYEDDEGLDCGELTLRLTEEGLSEIADYFDRLVYDYNRLKQKLSDIENAKRTECLPSPPYGLRP